MVNMKHPSQHEPVSHPIPGLIHTGVTLIESSVDGLPAYLALKISTGGLVFGTIPTTQTIVHYHCLPGSSDELQKQVDVIRNEVAGDMMSKGFDERHAFVVLCMNFKPYVNNESSFWQDPLKVLTVRDDHKCIFVVIKDKSAFETRGSEVRLLDAEAKRLGMAVVLVCSWDVIAEEDFNVIPVSSVDSNPKLTLRKLKGEEMFEFELPTLERFVLMNTLAPLYEYLGLEQVQAVRVRDQMLASQD